MAEAHKERVGRAIRQRREELDLSAEELGRRIPVAGKTVERWERGETFGHMDNLDRVAELLETDVATLMAGPSGEQEETPDLLGELNGSQLDRIESMLREVLGLLDPEATSADQAHEEQVEREIAAGVPDQQEPSGEAPPGRAAGGSRRASG